MLKKKEQPNNKSFITNSSAGNHIQSCKTQSDVKAHKHGLCLDIEASDLVNNFAKDSERII